jgi:V/A-type H+-transporting ATPase subunit C
MFIKYPDFVGADSKYAYAAGRIRALETRLLDRQRLERMLDSESAEAALRSLQDSDYGQYLADVGSAAEYERMLESEREAVYELFRRLCLDEDALSIYFSRFDFHNIRVLAKDKVNHRHSEGLLSNHGELEPRAMREIFEEERLDQLPEHLARASAEALEASRTTGGSRLLDITVDRSQHAHQLALAVRLSNDFLTNLLRLSADIRNILTLYRVKWLGEDYKLYHSAVLDGGFLEKDRLRAAFHEPWESVPSRFAVTPYAEVIEAGGSAVVNKGAFAMLEKGADDYIMGYLRLTKTVTFGLEPLYSYLLVKESELKSIRMIMVGKLYGIPPERIRERLPTTFAGSLRT